MTATLTAAVTVGIETISPDHARELIAMYNPVNRTVSSATVALYARLMRDGKWALNGESIQFDTSGNLLNGQHRLLAVIESDMVLTTMVVRGLPTESRDTMDQHRKRTAGDVLNMHGHRDGTHLASVARVVHRWDAGLRGATLMGAGQTMLSATEILDFLVTEPLILPAVEAVRRKDAEVLAPSRTLGPLWVLTHRADPDAAQEFFTRLITGRMLEIGNPILTLRRYFSNGREREARRTRAITSFTMLNAGVRAWNA